MPAPGFVQSAAGIDLSQRIAGSTAVVASPTDNTETVIGSVTVPGGLSYATGVFVVAWAAFTVGTNGVSINLKVRQTSVSGSTIAATGVTNEGVTAATQLGTRVVWGLDTAPGDSQIYKATLTVGSGSAASTVSALFLGVFAVQRVSEQLYEFTHDYPFHTPLPDLQPQNATSVAYAASLVAVTGRARCFGFQGYNSGAAQFILVLDKNGLPADGAVPVIVIPAAATSSFSAYFGSAGRWFNQGIVLCNSSTGPTKTIGAADCWFDVQYVSGDQGQPSVGIVSGGGGGGGGGVSFSTATSTVTANQGNGYNTSHTFDLGDGPHTVQITLTGLTLTGDGETFGNDPGTIFVGPNSGTTRLASSADGLVFGNLNSPNEIGPQATGAGGATFEIQSTGVTAKAVTTSGRYLKVPMAIVANDTGDIYAGANHPSAQIRIDLRYL